MYNRMNQDQNRNNRGANIFGNDDLNFNSDARKESFFSFLKWFFCPRFKALSVTFLLFLTNVIMFGVLLTRGIKKSAIPNLSFLAIDDKQFQDMGSLVIFKFWFLKKNFLIFYIFEILSLFIYKNLCRLGLWFG